MTDSASKYYDIIAPHYDKATAPENAWTPPAMAARFCRDIITSGMRVLDIGVGTGQSLEFLTGMEKDLKVFGIDVSRKMLDICRAKAPQVSLFQGDIWKFAETNPGRFDLIIASGVLEFIEDLNSFFETACDLMNDKGKIVFTYEPLILFHKFQKEEKSLVVENRESPLYTENFYTFRRTSSQIRELLTKHNIAIEDAVEFVAYRKGDADIIYEILRCQRN